MERISEEARHRNDKGIEFSILRDSVLILPLAYRCYGPVTHFERRAQTYQYLGHNIPGTGDRGTYYMW
jgi:hypothetical protein